MKAGNEICIWEMKSYVFFMTLFYSLLLSVSKLRNKKVIFFPVTEDV